MKLIVEYNARPTVSKRKQVAGKNEAVAVVWRVHGGCGCVDRDVVLMVHAFGAAIGRNRDTLTRLVYLQRFRG